MRLRKKEKEATMLRRTTSLDRLPSAITREKFLRFDLPMKARGRDSLGSEFEETTVVESMSHATAVFFLRSPVERGIPLRLAIDLPRKLSEENSLKLIIRGTVMTVDRTGGTHQRISLKLDSKYVIAPEVFNESCAGSGA
jgi:hypothetical protein